MNPNTAVVTTKDNGKQRSPAGAILLQCVIGGKKTKFREPTRGGKEVLPHPKKKKKKSPFEDF